MMHYSLFNIKLTASESLDMLEEFKKEYFKDIYIYSNDNEYCSDEIAEAFEYIENETMAIMDKYNYVEKEHSKIFMSYLEIIAKYTNKSLESCIESFYDFIIYDVYDNVIDTLAIKDIYEYVSSLMVSYDKGKTYTHKYECVEYSKDNNGLKYLEPILDDDRHGLYVVDRYEEMINLDEEYTNLATEIIGQFKDNIQQHFNDLTKNDTEVSRETLSHDEVIQALNNSISKFIEQHYQQPQELRHLLIDYTETPLKDYIEVTQNAINHSEDIKLLDRIFQTYKRDEQHRIYNYDLFAFLYYAYSLKISFEHLYNSELLKLLGVYTFKTGRDKPVLKNNKIELLQEHKKAVELTQYKENIYLHNLIDFIKTVNTKYFNRYLLSLLVNISHNLKGSKEFMNSLTCKDSFKNETYESLPQPINTLLLPTNQIAN